MCPPTDYRLCSSAQCYPHGVCIKASRPSRGRADAAAAGLKAGKYNQVKVNTMSLNYVSAAPTQRTTSFFIEDILHKPKPLRDVIPSPFCGTLASRMPILEYGYPLMPTPILAPHPHHPLHKPEHHQYFFTSGKTPTR